MNSFSSNWMAIKHYKNISETDEVPGIYIWGFFNETKFMPYYVGKAWNVASRLCEHLSGIKGGSYRIYKFNDLFHPKNRKPFYLPDSVKNRTQFAADEYTNSLVVGTIKDLTSEMIKAFHYTYVQMTISEFEHHCKIAERAILNKFKHTIVNSLIGRPEDEFDIGNIELYEDLYIRIL